MIAAPSTQPTRSIEQLRRTPHRLSDPGFPYGEALLQFLWSARLYDGRDLRTTKGETVEVIEPGRVQVHSGPDLEEARVRIAGQVWAGNVEVHVRSSEWNTHGHSQDPAYDNVILHVVYEHDADVRTSRGAMPPTVELVHRIAEERVALHMKLMQSVHAVPCSRQLAHVDRLRLGPWLERVLIERLERRTAFTGELLRRSDGDPSATLYHLLARAFGMQVNAEPFSMLAHVLPLAILRKYHDDPLRTEALLFGQAGMLEGELHEDHPLKMQGEYAHLARTHRLRSMPLAAWKFGRIRPSNFPTVRLAQFSALMQRTEGRPAALLDIEEAGELRAMLKVTAGTYWHTHHQFERAGPVRPKRLGTMAADHIIINAIVPALFAMGQAFGRPTWQERALALLHQLPAEQNSKLGVWAGSGLTADSAGRGQSLLELRDRYCRVRRCLSCGIGNQLMAQAVKGQ